MFLLFCLISLVVMAPIGAVALFPIVRDFVRGFSFRYTVGGVADWAVVATRSAIEPVRIRTFGLQDLAVGAVRVFRVTRMWTRSVFVGAKIRASIEWRILRADARAWARAVSARAVGVACGALVGAGLVTAAVAVGVPLVSPEPHWLVFCVGVILVSFSPIGLFVGVFVADETEWNIRCVRLARQLELQRWAEENVVAL